MSSHVLVVGAGLTALRTAEELRALGHDGPITLVGAEAEAPYDRPPLSKSALAAPTTTPSLREPDTYGDLGVTLRLGTTAVGLDTSALTVVLEGGDVVAFDALVVATGALPRRMPGLDGPGAHLLRTVGDSRALSADISRTGRLVVIGGGFIGCEVAATARGMGASVTLIEVTANPLARVLGDEVSAEVARMHADAGVDLRTGVGVTAVEGSGDERQLVLSDDSRVPAPVVLAGLGVTPAVGWLEGSGLALDNGVVCDEHGQTSVPGIWAAGDVASWWHPTLKEYRRVEHWSNAGDQGRAVATTIATGVPTGVDPVHYFWSDQYGVKIQSHGWPSAEDEVTMVRAGKDKQRLVALYSRGGMLTAVVGFGAAGIVARLRDLLAAGATREAALATLT